VSRSRPPRAARPAARRRHGERHEQAVRAEPAAGEIGSIERLDPRLDQLIAPGATMEKLAEGFEWSEGPAWDKAGNRLLFSDVPQNVVYEYGRAGPA
jgi:hypothetical protein